MHLWKNNKKMEDLWKNSEISENNFLIEHFRAIASGELFLFHWGWKQSRSVIQKWLVFFENSWTRSEDLQEENNEREAREIQHNQLIIQNQQIQAQQSQAIQALQQQAQILALSLYRQ